MPELKILGNPGGGSSDDARQAQWVALEGEMLRLLDSGDTGVADAVNAALEEAVRLDASDLHFEPWEDCLTIRLRIDGILHEVASLPKTHHPRIVARLKVLARIVTYQRDLPQDGRIDSAATPCNKAMRVSTFPTVNGEKVVVRILEVRTDLFRLEALGFRDDMMAALRVLLMRPQGTLLLTGPSSSGKTTTIYAALQALIKIRETAPHIVTIEDPVECRLERIAQTEIRPAAGFTFSAALRAVLRQDPEILVVGEIRDPETARTAIQAGLTGHLVISTIHSGTAAGVFTRLLDMGIEPYLIASSVTGVLAQRLIRVNCPRCSATYEPDAGLRARFATAEGAATFRKGPGCEACNGIGYAGRTAIGELLGVDDAIVDGVLARTRTAELHASAVAAGMVTLEEDGIQRAKDGVTTLEELARVLPPPGDLRLKQTETTQQD